MRLGKEDFRTLLNEPMPRGRRRGRRPNGSTSGLPSEFESVLEGAINVPLYFIRLKLKTLDSAVKYVVCCDTGRRRLGGAHVILNERGFQTYVLFEQLESDGPAGLNPPWPSERMRGLVAA